LTFARSQIGVPYAWGEGGYKGKSLGTNDGQGNDDSHVVGFNCSGLAQYAIYHGTNKIIARVSAEQYNYSKCHHVPIAQKQPSDLIFWNDGGRIHHVATVSDKPNEMFEAPESKKLVREVSISPHRFGVYGCEMLVNRLK
jgi:cell wall-associated NlpC family hydrolase